MPAETSTRKGLLIGLCGLRQSGKSTAAEDLRNEGFFERAFAAKLKNAVCVVFGLTQNQVYDSILKEVLDPRWNKTPRQILELFGTEVARSIDENVWVTALEQEILFCPDTNYVVSDCRFPNEVDMIHRNGGVVWRIHRSSCVSNGHASDQPGWLQADLDITNDGSLLGLRSQVLLNLNRLIAERKS